MLCSARDSTVCHVTPVLHNHGKGCTSNAWTDQAVKVQQTCMEAACCMVLRGTGMLTAPAQMSALDRANTAGPDALPL